MSGRILVVEDEDKLARFIELELQHEGYEVDKSGDGREALEMATQTDYDLVLLDIMLPGLNGLEVLRRLNQANPTPVILLTARDAVMDKVAGLDAGAVDYITKPFAIEELLARIRVALKLHGLRGGSGNLGNVAVNTDGSEALGNAASSSGINNGNVGNGEKLNVMSTKGVLTWKELVLDEKRHRVSYSGEEITLTNREFMMLKTLLENKDIVLSRDSLLERVCGYDYVGETNVVDVYIRFLRSKIDEVYGVKMIQTIRGVGYVIKAD